MQLFTSTVGRKLLMSVSGFLMVLFVIVHLLGNTSIFIPGGINAYAEHLHALPPLVWAFRFVMLILILVHAYYAIQITLENNAANPEKYAVKRQLKANFSSENMIWTGLLIAAFIIGHILHFTARVTPDISSRAASLTTEHGFDVFSMVVGSFQHPATALLYVAAMIALFLHLKHGNQSSVQTLGWNNDCTLPVVSTVGTIIAVIFLVGYSLIPLSILAGILNK